MDVGQRPGPHPALDRCMEVTSEVNGRLIRRRHCVALWVARCPPTITGNPLGLAWGPFPGEQFGMLALYIT
jgi:hypothetical protein